MGRGVGDGRNRCSTATRANQDAIRGRKRTKVRHKGDQRSAGQPTAPLGNYTNIVFDGRLRVAAG